MLKLNKKVLRNLSHCRKALHMSSNKTINTKLNIDPRNKERIRDEITACHMITLSMPNVYNSSVRSDIEHAVLDFGFQVEDDIIAPTSSTQQSLFKVKFYDIHKDLFDVLDVVIDHAVEACIYSQTSMPNDLFKRFVMKYQLVHTYSTAVYTELVVSSEHTKVKALNDEISSVIDQLRIDCTSNQPESSSVLGHYDPNTNSVSLFPLNLFTAYVHKAVKKYKAKGSLINYVFGSDISILRVMTVHTFLHEMCHAVERCDFEISNAPKILGKQFEESANRLLRHCTRFKLVLLYLSSKLKFTQMSDQMFADLEAVIHADSELDSTPIDRWVFKILPFLKHTNLGYSFDLDIEDISDKRIYGWEQGLNDFCVSYLNQSRLVYMPKSVVLATGRVGELIRKSSEFVGEKFKTLRPNFLETSETFIELNADATEFVYTYYGEPNLYFAEFESDPYEMIADMVLNKRLVSLDDVALTNCKVGLFLVSIEGSPQFIYYMDGFEPVELSIEEGWWLLYV